MLSSLPRVFIMPLRNHAMLCGRATLTLFLISGLAMAQAEDIGFQRFYDHNEFSLTAPGAQKFGLYGYDNPAQLHYVQASDLSLSWTADELAYDDQRWSATFAAPGFGFTFNRDRRTGSRVDNYQLGFGGGSDDAAAGLGIGWYRGDTDTQDLRTYFSLGTLSRPSDRTSVGIVGKLAGGLDYYEAVADVAFRPLGSPALALFADYVWGNADSSFGGDWSAGVSSELLPGVQLAGRYFDGGSVTTGLQFSFGNSSVSGQQHRPDGDGGTYNSYTVRTGALERNLFDGFRSPDRYLDVNLNQPLAYQQFSLFERRASLLNQLELIEMAALNDSVAGIVVDTTNMSMSPSMGWEIMTALNEFRSTGKRVVLYVENGNMTTLHLTAAADLVIMDPSGSLFVPGLVSGNTYLGGLLDDLGVGVDELREMEYKSAFEGLSRRDMSDADREQRQAMVDSFYEQIRSDVVAGRNMSTDTFDSVIERGLHLTPENLMDAGVVDRLAREDRVSDILRDIERRPQRRISAERLRSLQPPEDNLWGPRPRVSVIYASGTTSTDTGMRARVVAEALRDARDDPSVAAIVLRVDSPGGGILAADMVASEVRRAQRLKPVVISMGSYATSGGYWVSAFGTDILATPLTTTGSIGVISARLWDDGIGERWGLNAESVSRGTSADAGFGITVPLLGLTLPNRPYTDDERANAAQQLNREYDRFVAQVASGRDMPAEDVRELAAGRVYTGRQAEDVGLVDGMGNLRQAIRLAQVRAGIAPGAKIEIIEGPELTMPSVFDLADLVEARAVSVLPFMAENELEAYLTHIIEHRGQPQVMLPYEYLNWTAGEY